MYKTTYGIFFERKKPLCIVMVLKSMYVCVCVLLFTPSKLLLNCASSYLLAWEVSQPVPFSFPEWCSI